ncbi:MAG: ATP-binding cassette domain-containing protein [Bryobacteraceae bacterium]|nr:ATP-binding cassette domain-containing protein [Bryobacteraceae bacterium]
MNEEPVLEFRGVRLRIGEREILRGIDLVVGRGETVVLLGRSGSGKTTLLRCINGLMEPTSGDVLIQGKSTREQDMVNLRRRIGYVIQDGGLFPHFTVERNVAVVPRLEKWPEDRVRERVTSLLGMVGLPPEEYSARYPRQLSGGQRQRVGIARALAADPAILLLDEPFAALDPITRFELQKKFLELRNALGKTAVFVTHDVREALMMASKLVLLKDGQIELVATAAEFLESNSPEARLFLAGIEADRRTNGPVTDQ